MVRNKVSSLVSGRAFPMKDHLEVSEEADSGELAHRTTPTVEDINASRATATDRVFEGGSLAVLGFGGALLVDYLNLGPGLSLRISIGATLTAFGAGDLGGIRRLSPDSTWEKGLLTLAHFSGRPWWIGDPERGEWAPVGDFEPPDSRGLEPPRDGFLRVIHSRPHRHRAHPHSSLDVIRVGSNAWEWRIRGVRTRVNSMGWTTSG